MPPSAERLPTLGPADPATASATPAPLPALPAVRVLRQFRQIFNAVKTHFQQVERKVGLGGAQVWALGVIRDTPGIGISGLAEALNIHQSTASNLVRNLLDKDLIASRKDATDRRSVKLHLQAAGEDVLARSPGPLAGVLPDALAALDADTLQRLGADLAVLIQVLQADEAGQDVPLAALTRTT